MAQDCGTQCVNLSEVFNEMKDAKDKSDKDRLKAEKALADLEEKYAKLADSYAELISEISNQLDTLK